MDTSAATSSPDAAVSLSWVVNSVRDWVERCSSIWVEAQIIELKRRSGYQQFLTLHDVTEEVSATATCPRHVLDAAGPVEAGMTVFALIHPTVWRKSGRLSFVIAEIRPTGQGQLLAQLEARHGVKKPILVHAILETAEGVANVDSIASASPSRPSDLDSSSISPTRYSSMATRLMSPEV